MIYKIVHRTTYKYKYPVSVGSHVACLRPRTLASHRLTQSELQIIPSPAVVTERLDYFGNHQYVFTIEEPHDELVVEARSQVVMGEIKRDSHISSLPWEEAVKSLPEDLSPEALDAYQFRFESPRIRLRPEFARYAKQSFTPGRPLIESLLDLTALIHRDFRFDSKVTTVRTPIEEVFRKKRGVCQDFAHIQIACLRSINLSARYVSGYLRTHPPPGQPRIVGADASHAWVSAFCPGLGWLDVDPTNNVVPSTSHVTIAWGRDFGDVSPLHGLILGGGAHTLKVGVDLEVIES
jgi:transglutaminase-like putative cysteine protease